MLFSMTNYFGKLLIYIYDYAVFFVRRNAMNPNDCEISQP